MVEQSESVMDPYEALVDLHDRLCKAEGRLGEMAKGALDAQEWDEHARLSAKREGVLLALDYLRSYEEPPPLMRLLMGSCRSRHSPNEDNSAPTDGRGTE